MSSCPLKRKLLGPSWTMILTFTPSTLRTRATRPSTWTTRWRASSWCCQGRPPSTWSPTTCRQASLLSWAGFHSWLIQRWGTSLEAACPISKCFCHFVVRQSSVQTFVLRDSPMQKKIITQGQISQEHIKLNFSWRAFGRNMHLVIESSIIEWHPIFKYNYVIVIDPMIDLMLERFSTIEIILFILRGSPCLSFPH